MCLCLSVCFPPCLPPFPQQQVRRRLGYHSDLHFVSAFLDRDWRNQQLLHRLQGCQGFAMLVMPSPPAEEQQVGAAKQAAICQLVCSSEAHLGLNVP